MNLRSLLCVLCTTWFAAAHAELPFRFDNAFYLGAVGGYGSTNWSHMTSTDPSLQTSMPTDASDDGFTWGIAAGDNINDYFGAEFRYQRFADTKVSFAQYNEYNEENQYNAFTMHSKTEAYLFMGKLRAPVAEFLEIYSLLGGGVTVREDRLNSVTGFSGVFGAGADFIFTKHWHDSLEFNFITGNAAIDLAPAQYYQPFLTSFVNKIGFYF